MFSRLRTRFGAPGVIAVIALVFAMLGGAYAAQSRHHKKSGVIITKLNQIKPSVQKQLKGQAGAQGPQGPKGDSGSKGADGAAGSPGGAGAAGKSVVVGSFTAEEEELGEPAGEPCNLNGGTEVEVEGSGIVKFVCNGSPWTAGGTLPGGATETGAWNMKMAAGSGEASISFPIPLAAGLAFTSTKTNSLAAGTGTVTSGSKVITGLTHTASTPPWASQTPISGTGIPAGTQIVEVLGPTEIEISQNATASGSGVALSSSAWSQCDNGEGTAAGAENPEADTGFLCVFIGKATGVILTLAPFKSGTSAAATGASTAGAKLGGFSTTATDAVSGTFAVTD